MTSIPLISRATYRLMSLWALVLFVFSGSAVAQRHDIRWIEGPAVVDLGKDVAQIRIGESYVFANGEDTKKIMELMGNPPSNREVGMLCPKAKDKDWLIVFEYFSVGYIKDDEKDKIDSEAILEGIRRGTEDANTYRKESTRAGLACTGRRLSSCKLWSEDRIG